MEVTKLPERFEGMIWAVSHGIIYPLTDCCEASGTGSETPTGVACRGCYATVSEDYGMGFLLDGSEAMTGGRAPEALLEAARAAVASNA